MPPEIYFVALLFLTLGSLCIGSFLNVVIHRLPLDESVVHPRSRCPNCRKLIRWYQNIPVLSFLFLRRKCANCGTKISWRYPLVEALTGALFLAAMLWNPNPLSWPFSFYFLGAMIACTFIDLDHWILPDKITLPGILIGLVSSALAPHQLLQEGLWSAFPFAFFAVAEAATGFLIGGGVLYLVAWAYFAYSGKEGLGGGDIKFLAMVGAFLGVKGAILTLFLSSMTGAILGLFLIAFRGKKAGTAIPFGPFLAAGATICFFFGPPLWQWYFMGH